MSEINRLIAERVLKWQMIDRLHYKDEHGNWVMDGIEWDPEHNISHAHMALEKYAKEWTAYKREMADGKYAYSVTTINGLDTFCGNWADTKCAAICAAIKSALEGKE